MNNIQKLELDIMLKFQKKFEENNIDYFLCGGSLLGAIRHKGFIPWDDDIDIGMTRKNYNMFLEYARKNDFLIENRYAIKAGELRKYCISFCKN